MTKPAEMALVKPDLQFHASLWTLREYPRPAAEWTLREKFAEIKRQGFTGVSGRFVPEAAALCREFGLGYFLTIDVEAGDGPAQLRRAAEWNPVRVNVHLCEHDTAPAAAAEVWLELQREAAQLGLTLDLELHRDTATETPEKAAALAALGEQATGAPVRFCLDFSHFAVSKHLAPPYAPRLLAAPGLIAPARLVHFRPFNGHHAQVPATDGRGNFTPEFADYLEFVDALLAQWLKTAQSGDILHACPENGPRNGGYALSGFPDVWQDALVIRDAIRSQWARQISAWRPSRP